MQKKKALFIVINSFESGGAERTISRLLPYLSTKYNIHLILLKNAIFYNIPKNVTITPMSNIRHNFLLMLLLPLYIFKLRLLIKEYDPHKVISFLEIANFVNILSHKNAIISFRTSIYFFNNGFIKSIYRFLIKLLYPHAQKIIVNSKENAIEMGKELHIPSQKIRTIYNPIDSSEVSTSASKKINLSQFPKNKTVFITVGRLDYQKRLDMLIKLFTKDFLRDSILIIIGKGSERKKLFQLIQKNNISHRIFLLGEQKNVFPYLVFADYFMFASEVEGFPNVLIEAVSCGLPIITSDFKTGAREIIDPQLTYDNSISYPHYGPNGVLLGVQTFTDDMGKLDMTKLQQKKVNIKEFDIMSISQQWVKVIDEKI